MATCGKKRHSSREGAVAAAAAWMARYGDGKPMAAYLCSMCGSWHIGHRGRSMGMPKPVERKAKREEPKVPQVAQENVPKTDRCDMNCPKRAIATVSTTRGRFHVCDRHRVRLEHTL